MTSTAFWSSAPPMDEEPSEPHLLACECLQCVPDISEREKRDLAEKLGELYTDSDRLAEAADSDDAITEHLTGEDVGDSKDEPESVVR